MNEMARGCFKILPHSSIRAGLRTTYTCVGLRARVNAENYGEVVADTNTQSQGLHLHTPLPPPKSSPEIHEV